MKHKRKIILILAAIILHSCNSSNPKPAVFLGDNVNEWEKQFMSNTKDSWLVKDGRLMFHHPTEIGALSLSLDSIAPSGEEKGKLYVELDINGDFSEEKEDVFYGFELSNKGVASEQKLRFGVNGLGQIEAFNGNMQPIKLTRIYHECNQNAGDAMISFISSSKASGTSVNMALYNCEKHIYSQLGRVVVQDSTVRDGYDQLSLIAFNRDSLHPVWFKNLKINKNWAPFD